MANLAKHGITAATPSNIPLGAGVWFKNLKWTEGEGWGGKILGATSGGSSIKITPEVLDIEIDGAAVVAKGLAVMQGGTGEAEVNFAEINKDILAMTTLGEALDENSEHAVEGFDCIQTKAAITEYENKTLHSDQKTPYPVGYGVFTYAERLELKVSRRRSVRVDIRISFFTSYFPPLMC